MTGQILDGKVVADNLRQKIAVEVEEMVKAGKRRPGLATVLVGENPASQVYVRMKTKACEEAGIDSYGHHLPADASQAEIDQLVKELNEDERVDGILV